MNILSFPLEILYHCIDLLGPSDQITLKRTCKELCFHISSHPLYIKYLKEFDSITDKEVIITTPVTSSVEPQHVVHLKKQLAKTRKYGNHSYGKLIQ